MTPAQIQALIDACRTGPSDLVMWAELKAVLEGLKNQDGVTSFNGRDGIVVGEEGDYNLTDMGDVVISVPTTNQVLRYDGSDWVNDDETVYVPYTGATANVTLGEYGIKTGWYGFDLTPTGTPTDQGTMYWEDSFKTAAIIMNGVTQEIGHDQFYHAKNNSGTTIAKGTAVGFAGTHGSSGHLLITPFIANGTTPSTYFMGVTAEEITNGSFGKVQSFGRLDGINTTAFNEGDILYVSTTTAGAFQTTVPVAPNNIIQVAAVVSDSNNGKLLIRPTLGSKLTSDESVRITSVANGNVLQYNSSLAVWENVAPSSLAVNNIYTADGTLTGNRTVTSAGFSLTFTGAVNLASAAGNVGIGTTSPGEKLTVVGSSGVGKATTNSVAYSAVYNSSTGFVAMQQRDGTSARYGVNGMSELTSAGTGGLAIVSAAGAVHFGTSTNEMMRLFTTGNVLIQTGGTFTDGGFRLDVSGTIRSTTFISAGTGSTGGYYVGATSGSGAFMIRGYADTTNPGIEKVAANNSPFEFYQRGQSANAYTFRFSMTDTNSRAMSVGSGSVDNIRVLLGFGVPNANNISGNVLALRPVYNQTGSTNTGTILTGFYYEPTLTDLTGATHRAIHTVTGDVLFGTTSGNVGIGTTSPQSFTNYTTAHIVGRTANEGGIVRLSTLTSSIDALLFTDLGGLTIRTSTSNDINFQTGGNNTRMRIFSNGNIAINSTTDAGYKLDVSGSMRSTSFLYFSNNQNSGIAPTTNSIAIEMYGGRDVTNAYRFGYLSAMNIANSTRNYFTFGETFFSYTYASGTNIGRIINFSHIINTTGGTNTITAIYYNPTLTSTTGTTHNFLHNVSGNVLLCTSSGYVGIGATADTSYLLSVDGDLRVYGNIRTAQPTGGTAVGVWRLGSTATGTFIMSTTVCVEIEIGGTLYKLATVS
jgi:hypothetical protein